MRLTPDKALQALPALQRAAEAISRIDAEGAPESTDSISS
jgi:hypothetical protein